MDKILNKRSGFTLIEVLVAVSIFAIIALAIYQGMIFSIRTSNIARAQIIITAIANEEIEIARNLSYADVGILNGWPIGKLQASKEVTRDNRTFLVETTIRSIDDDFDGTIGGIPNDTAPADYKLIELAITCQTCPDPKTERFNTLVAPTSLESSSDNGALFVQAFDALGIPVIAADVQIENASYDPPFTINDITNNDGVLQLVDLPPGYEAYRIIVSKDGYSTERTYPSGGENPNPIKPDATVETEGLTQTSFTIDLLGSLNINTVDLSCINVPNVDFTLTSLKLIGTDPDVYKYEENHETDGSGNIQLNGLEWDSYSSVVTDSSYELYGTIPLSPVSLAPNSNQDITMIVGPKSPKHLLVAVLDETTQQPLTDATVHLTGPYGYDQTRITDRGFMLQTDWSGGDGQDDFIDSTKYFSQDNNIKDSSSGQLTLAKFGYRYVSSGYLTSSTFDLGAPTEFHQILWQPQSQDSRTGEDSVRMQIAANNDNETWDFVGPDGSSDTYYTLTEQNMWDGHNDTQYLRYRVYLRTENTRRTPTISDILFTFTSGCTPPGQTSFTGLNSGNYSLAVSRDGYSDEELNFNLSSSWSQINVNMNP